MSRTSSEKEKRDYDIRLDALLDHIAELEAQAKVDRQEIAYLRAIYGARLLEASGRDAKNPFAT